MSDSNDTSAPRDSDGEEIPAPPLPNPDLHPIYTDGTGYSADVPKSARKSKKEKKREQKQRKHPTDPYQNMNEKKGCKSCCGCLGGLSLVALLIFVALGAIVYLYGPGKYLKDGYELEFLPNASTTISEAPENPTLYVGREIIYEVPVSSEPIAIVGMEVTLDGIFSENVSATGSKVIGAAGSIMKKDLEIFAAEFSDQGITLEGKLLGRVGKNTQ